MYQIQPFGEILLASGILFKNCKIWGYGAGGGENYRSGYNGVAVFIICK